MRNVLLTFFAGVLFISVSCLPVGSTNNAKRAEMGVSYKLKGSWVVSDISYDKDYLLKPFDEMVNIDCFKGSVWKLIPNNDSGSYTVSNSDCVGFTTEIRFNVTKDGVFSFKKIPLGTKPKSVVSGYFLKIQNYTPESFELVQDLGNNIKPTVYYFQKIN